MRVTETTEQRLVIRQIPFVTALGFLAAAAMFLAAGGPGALGWDLIGFGLTFAGLACLGGVFYAIRIKKLTLDRVAGEVQIMNHSLAGRSVTTLPLADLERLEVKSSGSGRNKSFWVVLVMRSGKTHRLNDLDHGAFGQIGQDRAVAKANDWLKVGAS